MDLLVGDLDMLVRRLFVQSSEVRVGEYVGILNTHVASRIAKFT